MKNNRFDKTFFVEAFSEARMNPYFDRYPGDERLAIKHYENNIRFAESLWPSLSVFEVVMKNTLIRELERMTRNKEWYLFFKVHPALKRLYDYVSIAENHIIARGETVVADKINGELTLGFWVSLFNAEYERYLWKDLRRAFPNMPKSIRQRKNISAPLNAIRALRNRVSHNEPISWSLSRLTDLHSTIVTVTRWINISVMQWLPTVDRYATVVKNTGNPKVPCKEVHRSAL